jgi:hypothetical protein
MKREAASGRGKQTTLRYKQCDLPLCRAGCFLEYHQERNVEIQNLDEYKYMFVHVLERRCKKNYVFILVCLVVILIFLTRDIYITLSEDIQIPHLKNSYYGHAGEFKLRPAKG